MEESLVNDKKGEECESAGREASEAEGDEQVTQGRSKHIRDDEV